MIVREVKAVSVDHNGFVTHLINVGESWSPRASGSVVLDLDLGEVSYFVDWPEGKTEVLDASDARGRYLDARRDGSRHNSLLDMPREVAA